MKIGSVPYLNARPLVDWLERHPHPGVEVVYAVPSRLIAQLLAGELDMVMASTFPLLEHPALHLLPGLGVTASGPVLSVRLLSRVPVREIRTVALDSSSRSSVVLARIILAERYGITPTAVALPPQLNQMLDQADAAVLIGDIGLTVSGDGLYDLDLGQEWWELTGLPFYFAGWIGRDASTLTQAAPMLLDACEHGLARLPEIAHAAATRLHTTDELCYRYLAQVMRYHTGPAELAGLTAFRQHAERLHLVSRR